MLWESDRHQPVTDTPWDEALARAAIRAIVADTARAFDEDALWPPHELDELDGPGPMTSIYFGASGVAWAVDKLRGHLRERDGHDGRDWCAHGAAFVDRYLRQPDTGERVPSFLLGELGVRMVANAEPERMFALIASNIDNPTLEPLWGAPGTMVPALILFERTGDERWRELYLQNAASLIDQWHFHDHEDVWMWTQHLYGHVVRLLGAGHGFAGNVFALLRGFDVLSKEQQALTCERARHTLLRTAQRKGGLANWAQHVGVGRPGRDAMLVQWCHGAPGMITALAGLPADDELDRVLCEGGELTWRAGPLAKGSGLCHGTAGNGYAFLALAARTGDPMWLERARRFGMHAIAQVEAAREAHGRGRYSLWTGDLGVALYLQDCIDGAGQVPSLAYL